MRDAGKDAVADALVVIEPATNGVPASAGFLSKNPNAPSASTPGRRVTTTNSRGRFAFEGVDAGDYFLQVIADDHLGAMHSIKVPDPMAFVDTVYVDVNLTPTGTFTGVATLQGASNHVGIVVFAEGTSYVAVTGTNGDFELSDVPVGGYFIRAMRPGYLDDTEVGTLTTAGEVVALPPMQLALDTNIPPTASIAITNPERLESVPIQFVGTGADLDGTVVRYQWDFEDDGTFDYDEALSGTTSHPYAAGTYQARLVVTDDDGAIGSAVVQLVILPARVYVAPNGNDLNPGVTPLAPVLTLERAYQILAPVGYGEILVQAGNYEDVPQFVASIDVLGGRDPLTWNESASSYSSFKSDWYTPTSFPVTVQATANYISTPTRIRRIAITSTGLASNSIALYSTNSTAALRFEECRFVALNGMPGANGAAGEQGTDGGAGAPGLAASCDTPIDNPGGAGGTSAGGCAGEKAGMAGFTTKTAGGASWAGAAAGMPVCTETVQTPYSRALNLAGTAGAGANATQVGTPGVAAPSSGQISLGQWLPNTSADGTDGESGKGGGGGGGAGGQGSCGGFCNPGAGGSGGGGGGGGAGGGGGGGGQGGFASFAAMLVGSSPTVENCHFETGLGGAGGSGGNAAAGGLGGPGGEEVRPFALTTSDTAATAARAATASRVGRVPADPAVRALAYTKRWVRSQRLLMRRL